LGVVGFEPGGRGLKDRVKEIKDALNGRNIKVSAICAGFQGFILSTDPAIRKQCMDTMKEIMAAAKKASIHDFIMTLPKGYDTEVGELGDTLSGGEKQRIGIARAFLHDSPLLLLDEPTSNLDSLNEGIILKSLKEDTTRRTVVLVSHRVSTMNVADVVYEMENGRLS